MIWHHGPCQIGWLRAFASSSVIEFTDQRPPIVVGRLFLGGKALVSICGRVLTAGWWYSVQGYEGDE